MVPMLTSTEVSFLAAQGWDVQAEPFDLCWMDCSDPGWLKTWLSRGSARPLCICLCERHAVILEQGAFAGDYSGAPLPPDSMASEWPWRYCAEVSGT